MLLRRQPILAKDGASSLVRLHLLKSPLYHLAHSFGTEVEVYGKLLVRQFLALKTESAEDYLSVSAAENSIEHTLQLVAQVLYNQLIVSRFASRIDVKDANSVILVVSISALQRRERRLLWREQFSLVADFVVDKVIAESRELYPLVWVESGSGLHESHEACVEEVFCADAKLVFAVRLNVVDNFAD